MILGVTLTIAAACGVIALWLAIRVSQRRLGADILIGDGGDTVMVKRGRAHANFVENAPLVLILMGGIELAGGNTTALWAAGALFVVARVAHPFGMDRDSANALRAGGMIGTWIVLAALSGWAAVLAFQASGAPTEGEPVETILPMG